MSKEITYAELVEKAAAASGVSKKATRDVLDAAKAEITGALVKGEKINLGLEFGKFEAAQRDARIGRNPATGESVEIPAKKAVKFKPAKKLKDALA